MQTTGHSHWFTSGYSQTSQPVNTERAHSVFVTIKWSNVKRYGEKQPPSSAGKQITVVRHCQQAVAVYNFLPTSRLLVHLVTFCTFRKTFGPSAQVLFSSIQPAVIALLKPILAFGEDFLNKKSVSLPVRYFVCLYVCVVYAVCICYLLLRILCPSVFCFYSVFPFVFVYLSGYFVYVVVQIICLSVCLLILYMSFLICLSVCFFFMRCLRCLLCCMC